MSSYLRIIVNRIVHVIMVVLFLIGIRALASAQEFNPTPRRTAEERAMKQTEMLIRDLNIQDSVLRDTIYRVHLRYARKRDQATNRTEVVECINSLLAELKDILTPAQYERLQTIPQRHGARVPQSETENALPAATPIGQ